MDNFKYTNRFNTGSAKYDGMAKKYKRDDFLAFSVADSDYPTATPIINTLKESVERGVFGYTMIDDDYLKIVKDWYQRRYDANIKKHWIVPSTKVLSAISFLIEELCDKEDKVMIQTPVYHMFEVLINQTQRKIVDNPLINNDNHYRIDFDLMEKQFKKDVKVLLLCSPHNPVGRVWSQEELKQVIALAKKYEVFIISDEIHGDLVMADHTFHTLTKDFDIYENIAVVSAPSKTFNIAGLQSSNMIIAKKSLRDAMKKTLRKNFVSSPNMLAIQALKTAYTECDEWLSAQNSHIESNYQMVKKALNPFDITIAPLEGTYLVWLDMNAYTLSSQALFDHFLKEGVIVSKGKDFSDQYDGFIRLNVAVSKSQLEEGLKRITKVLNSIN